MESNLYENKTELHFAVLYCSCVALFKDPAQFKKFDFQIYILCINYTAHVL